MNEIIVIMITEKIIIVNRKLLRYFSIFVGHMARNVLMCFVSFALRYTVFSCY